MSHTTTPQDTHQHTTGEKFRHFLHLESSGGVFLVLATIIALILANSPAAELVADFWHAHAVVQVGPVTVDETLHHWINDALMSVFFLVAGLEIKRELVAGELRDPKRAALPAVAAIGGMVVPALIYTLINVGGDGANGWGVPLATDIAFAVAVLAIVGKGLPSGLKVFLLSLAIADDIGEEAFDVYLQIHGPSRNALGVGIERFTDDVPDAVKKERNTVLLDTLQGIASEENARFVGRRVEVLVEGPSRSDRERLTGRARDHRIVVFPAENGVRQGDLVEVDITSATALTLTGRLASVEARS